MHVGVVTVQIRRGKLEGAVGIYRDSLVPILERLHGFAGGRLLIDLTSGKGVMLSLWEGEADLMQRRFGPLRGTFFLGLLWGAWHFFHDLLYKQWLAASVAPHIRDDAASRGTQANCPGWPVPLNNPPRRLTIRNTPPIYS